MKAITITINKIDEKEVYHYDYIQDAMDFLNKELKRLTGSYFDNYLGRYYLYVRFKKIGYCFENGGIMYFYDEISKNDTFEMPFLGLKKKKDAKIYQSFSIKINNHALFLQTNGRSVMYPEGYVPIKEQKQRIKDGKLRSQKIF